MAHPRGRELLAVLAPRTRACGAGCLCAPLGLWLVAISMSKPLTCGYGGALGGTRTPNLLIRRSGQVVQDRPSPVVRWADVPQLSACVSRCPPPWQQYWQQPQEPETHTRSVQWMARVRSGQAPAWPLSSGRSVRRDTRGQATSRVRTPGTSHLCSSSCGHSHARLEGRTRTLSGPSPDLRPAKTLAPSARITSAAAPSHCQPSPVC
jgi:hypothetical protein